MIYEYTISVIYINFQIYINSLSIAYLYFLDTSPIYFSLLTSSYKLTRYIYIVGRYKGALKVILLSSVIISRVY
jgi:hypothetical protein